MPIRGAEHLNPEQRIKKKKPTVSNRRVEKVAKEGQYRHLGSERQTQGLIDRIQRFEGKGSEKLQ